MENIWIYLLFGICTIAYLLTAWDKHQAVYNYRRVPTAVILIPSILFGAFGTLCAMVLFNHKTRNYIAWLVPILVVIQLTLIIIWRSNL